MEFPPPVNTLTSVLMAMMYELLTCVTGAVLLPAFAAGTTAVQPERPGSAAHTAADGSTAAHPASVGCGEALRERGRRGGDAAR